MQTIEIELTQGQTALVDLDDYFRLGIHLWYFHATGYAARNIPIKRKGKRRQTIEYLHRAIMKPPKGMVVDHINHNKLDNRKCNLRVVTVAENNRNRRKVRKALAA